MFNKIFKNLFRLMRETAGRGIITDSETGDLYVILPASEYERLASGIHRQSVANLNEEEMLEKINKEIAFWHSLQEEKQKYEEFEEILRKDREKKKINKALENFVGIDIDKESKERVGLDNFDSFKQKKPLGSGLTSLKDVLDNKDLFGRRNIKKEELDQKLRKKNDPDQEFFANSFFQEEDLSNIPEEEERFYLEPVE